MKKLFALFLFLYIFSFLNAQNMNPVTWQVHYKSISATEGEIIIDATIEKTWHTYSQRPTDDGPVPTSFSFNPSTDYELIGKTEETDAHEEFVPAFEAKIFVFKDKAQFIQKVKGKPGATVNFSVEYMSCDDKMCLPPKTVPLNVKIQ
jgi:DsbC/DsbD-like thiol-disulfide interchange protein